MVSLFKKASTKQPTEIVKALREALSDKGLASKKVAEELARGIGAMRQVVQEANPDMIVLLSNEVYNADLIPAIIHSLTHFDFEAKKDVVYVVTHLLERQVGSRFPTVEYMSNKGAGMLEELLSMYEESELAVTVGTILRGCLKHEPLAKLLLNSPSFWSFFKFVESFKFDVASDAFTSFRQLMTEHKDSVAQFLERNYDTFFDHYNELLGSQNFVTKRQSLKLLGELLLDRTNFTTMTKYISSAAKMKQIMILLRDKSRPIQYEAFHVFKVFVANPNKPQPILDILIQNQQTLVTFLENFQNDRSEEEQFKDEKAFLIKQIQGLH